VAAPVGYEIDRLIEPHPIFPLIQRHAGVDDSEMFEVFNMGLGFCYVVDPASADHTLAILKARSRPRTPPAPPQAAWAPSTWVAAPLVLAHDNARAAVGFGTGKGTPLSRSFPPPLSRG
jgi:hypothetical protein